MSIDPRRRFVVLACLAALIGCDDGESLDPNGGLVGGIKATAVDMRSIQVQWAAIAGASGYVLERRANLEGDFLSIGERFPKSQTAYFDRGLQPNTTYGYRIVGVNDFGDEIARTPVAGARTAPEPGIQVTVQSILGGDARFSIDSSGYQARVRLALYDQNLPVEINGSQLFQPLDAGTYQVTLEDVAPNCTVGGEAIHSVPVTSSGLNTVATTSFVVTCRDRTRGRVSVVVQANGDTTDADGYQVSLTGLADDTSLPDSVRAVVLHQHVAGAGGTALFDNVLPGSYSVTIESVAPVCKVDGKVQRDSLKVMALGDLSETYDVTCTATGGGGPSGPYTLRAQWQPDTAPTSSIVKLSTSIDMGQGNPRTLAGFQFQMSTSGGVVRLDSIVDRTPGFTFTGNVQSETQGIAIGSKVSGVGSGVVPLADFYYTVTGASGRSVRPQLDGVSFISTTGDDFSPEVANAIGTFTVGTKLGTGSNAPPVAHANGPYSGTAGSPIVFSATGSTDPDGTITTYAWNFGDGQSGTGQTASHSYASAGAYQAQLVVTDDKGATGTATAAVTVSGTGTQTTPFVWRSAFGPVRASDNSVSLTISLDLSTDIPETPGTEALQEFVVDGLQWDKTILRYTGFSFSSGTGSLNFLQATNGRISFRGSIDPSKSTGLIPVAVVRFVVIGGVGTSTTTQTTLGALTGTTATGAYAYRPRTTLTEGTLTVGTAPAGTTVGGTVTSSQGGGVAGVTVTLSGGAGTATTASNGTFSIANVAAGTYTATLSSLPTGCTTPAAKDVTVATTPVTGVDFVVTCGASGGTATVTGTVSKSSGGGPLANVGVRLTPGNLGTTTAANGTYSFANVSTGSHQVSLTPATLPAGCTAPQAKTVTVPSTGSVKVDFSVSCTVTAGTGTVQGQIAFAAGSGTPSLAGASITATPNNQNASLAVNPDPQGSYTIPNVLISSDGGGTVKVSNLPSGCSPTTPTANYSGLSTAGTTVTAPTITITCPAASNNYRFTIKWGAPSGGKITMTGAIDMSTRNDPSNNGSGPDAIAGFQLTVNYPTSRLSAPVCSAGQLTGPINVDDPTPGQITPVLTKTPSGATGNAVVLFTCTFNLTGTGPTAVTAGGALFLSPANADFTSFVDLLLDDVP